MDIYLSGQKRNNDYFLSMGEIVANDLIRKSKALSTRHIKDFFIRTRFENEIKVFSDNNLNAIKTAKSDHECKTAINNIKVECYNLEKQGTLLSLKQAKVFVSVKIEEHDGIVGYIINGIGVIVSGVQVAIGAGILFTSIPTGNLLGIVAGAHIFISGVSSVVENIDKLRGNKDAVGFMPNIYMNGAEFFGFDRKTGMLAYYSMDFTTSFYGILKFSLKPEAWRLFDYLPTDHYRKINTMSKSALMFKMATSANKIRTISETYLTDKSEFQR
ncbi:DUF4225 domain-containing protein [Yersinia wautersii]|uniref:Inner membrane protein n=1 Tax=Yersinia wautersii TaxID=1341643 RepID=A0ABM9TJR8_9GAMM|nr:DUF4225 domain-containing protein [Yersinia wautersii]CRG52252.1 putative inner membrane protein [Yersinia wautersii]